MQSLASKGADGGSQSRRVRFLRHELWSAEVWSDDHESWHSQVKQHRAPRMTYHLTPKCTHTQHLSACHTSLPSEATRRLHAEQVDVIVIIQSRRNYSWHRVHTT